jgi:hypothetical protein
VCRRLVDHALCAESDTIMSCDEPAASTVPGEMSGRRRRHVPVAGSPQSRPHATGVERPDRFSPPADDVSSWRSGEAGAAWFGRPAGRSGRAPDGKGVELMPSRRYEFRVAGLLSESTRGAFPDMAVRDAPAETIISG